MPSVGESAARGLESGFRLAMEVQDRGLNRQRLERQGIRQEQMDERTRQQQERAIAAHDEARQLNALQIQEKDFAAQMQADADSGTKPNMATQQARVALSEGIRQKKQALLGNMGGYDPTVIKKKAAANVQALQRGDLTPFQNDPGSFTQTVTAITGRPPSDYRAGPDGEPPLVVQGAQQLSQGMETGDSDMTLSGANILFASELNSGRGGPGRHGGTIVAKRIVRLLPDPNSKDDRVIPTVRVYVNNGKKEASGDEIRARRASDPDAPMGATGHYDAPLTERRSADANDPVKSISIRETLARVDQQMQMVDVMNTQEAQALLEGDAQSGWDPERYLRISQAYESRASKSTTKMTGIPAGGLLQQTIDARGNVTAERTVPPAPAAAKPSAKPTLFQEAELAAEKYGISLAKARALVSPSKAANAAAGLSTGAVGGGGGGSVPGLKEREQVRKEQKDVFDRADKNADNAEKAVDTARQKLRDLNSKANNLMYDVKVEGKADAADRAELQAEIKVKDAASQRARERASSLSKDLDKPLPEDKAPTMIRFDKSGKNLAPITLKFDKDGNRVKN